MKTLTKPARSASKPTQKVMTPSVDEAQQPYKKRRNFTITADPSGSLACAGAQRVAGSGVGLSFVIQKHWASSLHNDFRLELGGTMKSWAVPKAPSLDTKDKRLAVQVASSRHGV